MSARNVDLLARYIGHVGHAERVELLRSVEDLGVAETVRLLARHIAGASMPETSVFDGGTVTDRA